MPQMAAVWGAFDAHTMDKDRLLGGIHSTKLTISNLYCLNVLAWLLL